MAGRFAFRAPPTEAPGAKRQAFNPPIQQNATGFLTTAPANETITNLIFAKPYRDGWQADYAEGSFFFINKAAGGGVALKSEITDAFYALADVPTLNYFLQISASTNLRGLLRQTDDYDGVSDRFAATSIREFREKWSQLGVFQKALLDSDEITRPVGTYVTPQQRLIDYSPYARVIMPNLWGRDVRVGDRLVFAVRRMRPYHSEFYNPRGESIGVVAAPASPECLQVWPCLAGAKETRDALVLYVGVASRAARPTSVAEIAMAVRSSRKWRDVMRYAPLEVELGV
jgi:hypothetical protein